MPDALLMVGLVLELDEFSVPSMVSVWPLVIVMVAFASDRVSVPLV